ncbi:hypothetical protein ASF53_11610 [Methylobacterium sp. Leaf123]|nr:hypothetical protein ASF53_11610 [Methylobacterium sp. Leaf123]
MVDAHDIVEVAALSGDGTRNSGDAHLAGTSRRTDLRRVKGYRRTNEPQEIVSTDIDYRTLLFAAIRLGSLDALNARFPAHHPLFGPP